MARYKPKYMKKKQPPVLFRGKLPVLIALVCILLAGSVWGVSAKYVYRNNWDSVAKASEFYFTSDLLTPTGKIYTLNPGDAESVDVAFELRNYDGLKLSELDISYTVTVTSSGSDTVTPVKGTGKLGNILQGEETETVMLKGLLPGNTYTVTATGENGYSQTLSATFVVKADTSGVFKNTRIYNDYVLLTVWTEGKSGQVTIDVPAGLIPDATDSALTSLYTNGTYPGTSFSLTLESYQSRSYRFFITNAYNGSVIPVSYGNTPLEETALS